LLSLGNRGVRVNVWNRLFQRLWIFQFGSQMSAPVELELQPT